MTDVDPLSTVPTINLISGSSKPSALHIRRKKLDRTIKIFAAALDRTLGDFLSRNIYAAAVKMQFKSASLAIYFRDDRPYKKDLVAINPYVDDIVSVSGRDTIPIDFFYSPADRFPIPGANKFIKRGLADPDIVLVPSMMGVEDLLRFDRHPIFRIPEDRVSKLADRLTGLGLDPNRWFCCVYYRQPNYGHRGPAAYRDVDDRPFEALSRHIVSELGGQVVRLGHPEMRSFDLGPSFVDLSRLKDEFMVQAMAVSRARFMVTTSSGPAHLPGAFDVPYVVTNSLSIWAVWTPAGMIMPNHLISPQRHRIDVRQLLDAGRLDWDSVRLALRNGCRIVENSAAELCAAARMLHERTSDCLGWRPAATRSASRQTPPNRYGIFQPYRRKVSIVEFPEFWPEF
jgi:putative glycosyltransferase (TIGR04372 family)